MRTNKMNEQEYAEAISRYYLSKMVHTSNFKKTRKGHRTTASRPLVRYQKGDTSNPSKASKYDKSNVRMPNNELKMNSRPLSRTLSSIESTVICLEDL